jgi:hypothetical protein
VRVLVPVDPPEPDGDRSVAVDAAPVPDGEDAR